MKKIIRYILLILYLATVLTACNKTNRSGIDRSDVVPENDMVAILTDLYIAEGLLNYPPVRSDFSSKDSIENYIDVIVKHGYTKEEVDKSMRYYFIDKPQVYKNIYDKVIENLSGIEADVIQKISDKPDIHENLWNGERSYSLPDVGVSNPVEFSIPTKGPGEYIIKARITLYEDDQSTDPRSEIWFWYDDGSEEGVKIPWDTVKLQKNGRPEIITMKKNLDDPRVTHLQGKLLDHTDKTGHWEKHALVTNITVTRSITEKNN